MISIVIHDANKKFSLYNQLGIGGVIFTPRMTAVMVDKQQIGEQENRKTCRAENDIEAASQISGVVELGDDGEVDHITVEKLDATFQTCRLDGLLSRG